MSVIEKDNHDYIGYDYYSMKVDKQKVSMYIDYYESFGWTLEDHDIYKEEISKGNLHFKRERKIMNKVELTRLQRQLEDCLNQIQASRCQHYMTSLVIPLVFPINRLRIMMFMIIMYLQPVMNLRRKL